MKIKKKFFKMNEIFEEKLLDSETLKKLEKNLKNEIFKRNWTRAF